jgi:hypothetical protein
LWSWWVCSTRFSTNDWLALGTCADATHQHWLAVVVPTSDARHIAMACDMLIYLQFHSNELVVMCRFCDAVVYSKWVHWMIHK